MEGCLLREYFDLDYTVKNTLDTSTALRLIGETGTEYIVVDKKWFETRRPNLVEALLDKGVLQPVEEVNRFLSKAVVFKVVGDTVQYTSPKAELEGDSFLTPSRILGLATSIAGLAYSARIARSLRRIPPAGSEKEQASQRES
ncbi:hypothetical protein ACSU1N_04025 [Thermogladius sp. 4427co]|uniref:hypothetical protein n=1 Tax=Thermogladius sp. 4427co TaxID=3450718 RepID=UPI003F78B4CD